MNAKPAHDDAPAPADEAPPWLYRSEGFAEDLDDVPVKPAEEPSRRNNAG